jgi:5-methylcytosine-specific restriction endonuclease McrA
MTQRRYEFSRKIKQEALKRSGGKCEATGARYGYPDFHRCNRDLAVSLEFDHYPLPAYQKGSDTLENCIACCKKCNQHAANNTDKTRAAKERRVNDKHLGIKRVKQKIQSRGFRPYPSNAKDINEDRL